METAVNRRTRKPVRHANLLAPLCLCLASGAHADPPTTVNGIELGTEDQFTSFGPATVCMRELVLRPLEGQSVQLLYSGIHSGTLRLTLADGTYVDFTDGEIFRDQRSRRSRPIVMRDDMGIYRIRRKSVDTVYQLEGLDRTDGLSTPSRVMVRGTALSQERADLPLLGRASFENPADVKCDRRYAYGWGVILDGEPIYVDSPSDGDKPEN